MLPAEPVSSSLAQSVMSMASSQSQHSQLSTDTVSSMSGSYVAPGTEEEGDTLPSPAAATASDGEVGGGQQLPEMGWEGTPPNPSPPRFGGGF